MWKTDGKGRLSLKALVSEYNKRECMIPMRDGVRLYTAIYAPLRCGNEKPILLMRSPFGLHPYGKGYAKNLRTYLRNYVLDGYTIVFQNVRGRYLSEGEFVHVRPLSDSGTDEATDAYDTVEWLLANTSCNGNVGVIGNSYPGFYATMAALSGHPAIKAVSPQAPVTDWYLGDDLHQNGAFALADSYSFGAYCFSRRKSPSRRAAPSGLRTQGGLYEFFRNMGLPAMIRDISSSRRRMQGSFWEELFGHPDYDGFWKDRNTAAHIHKGVSAAVLVVGGSYDAEDCHGAFSTYRAFKDSGVNVRLVIGPWGHGSWRDRQYCGLDGAFFGNGLSDKYLDEIEYPFFAHHLMGKPFAETHGDGSENAETPRVLVLPSGDSSEGAETPQWESLESWPPEALYTKLYPDQSGGLSFDCPARESPRSIEHNPDNPVPYYHEDLEYRTSGYMAADQSFCTAREDVLSYKGEPLESPLKLEGKVKVRIELSLSSEDADLVVKIIDLRPDAYAQLVRMGIMPVRYRNGFDAPEPAVPGEKMTLCFELEDIAHIFMPGHRIMIQVQGSCFPLFALSPSSFVRSRFDAMEKDYGKSVISVHSGPGTYLELPVRHTGLRGF